MNAATRRQLTTTDTRVEVQVTDFSPAGFKAGFPKIWVAGTVTNVEHREDGLVEVMVRTDEGHYAPHLIGPRGGGAGTLRLA